MPPSVPPMSRKSKLRQTILNPNENEGSLAAPLKKVSQAVRRSREFTQMEGWRHRGINLEAGQWVEGGIIIDIEQTLQPPKGNEIAEMREWVNNVEINENEAWHSESYFFLYILFIPYNQK